VKRKIVCGVAAVSAAVGAASAPLARADDLSVRLSKPWVARAEANFAATEFGIFKGGNSASSAGVAVGRTLTERFSAELLFGYGGSDRHGGPGFTEMATLRAAALTSGTGQHALTVGAGPMLVAGGAWGTVPFFHTELAYEMRLRFGLTLLVGPGLDLVLSDSKDPPPENEEGDTWFEGDAAPFKAGQIGFHARIALGWSF
jgi:hypothetical protein